MSEPGYEIVPIGDLESFATAAGTPVMRPVQRRLGVRPFGVNCWSAKSAGDRVIERHQEVDGPEELYVVVTGRATFTVGEQEIDAPAGTLIFVPPATVRAAFATEAETTVLAVGGKPGEAYEPTGWEEFLVADAYRRAGDADRGRETIRALLARKPGVWQGEYNAACFEALAGDAATALAHLAQAASLAGPEVREIATNDTDLDSLRDDPGFAEAIA